MRGVDLFGGSQQYTGKVFNLDVDTDEPKEFCYSPTSEHSYMLVNGHVVHNGPETDK
ncbi:MAG: hypothetical protein WBD25_10175 [Terriglobales bacterium]